MKKSVITFILPLLLMSACCSQAPSGTGDVSWKERLEKMLPLLGHRNWIVITDMAYPLQSGEGIVTLYADEPYTEVLEKTVSMVNGAPHVFAHLYRDKELEYITDDMVPGVEDLKRKVKDICGPDAVSVMHEDLIKRLDEAGKLYTVVIIKTPLTVPYTTAFFELDCGYWGPDKQAVLDEKINK